MPKLKKVKDIYIWQYVARQRRTFYSLLDLEFCLSQDLSCVFFLFSLFLFLPLIVSHPISDNIFCENGA